ncbi:MAG TPA: hydrogenase maturation nickel metallochaperone HypA [Acidimicrobiales bacterium]|nr:hydrogenase maturation nickel metallochaperone HypA [Acidimicrobiales bacterium]
MAIAESIFDTVTARRGGRRVERVDVRIGYLRQVVPDALEFAWQVRTQDTDLAGCILAIDHVPAVVVCEECGATTTLDLPIPQCDECEGFEVTVVSGEEFDLLSFDEERV